MEYNLLHDAVTELRVAVTAAGVDLNVPVQLGKSVMVCQQQLQETTLLLSWQ